VKVTYKLSASAGLSDIPGATQPSSTSINGSARAAFVAASGSFRNNSVYAPAQFNIFVPDYGKIVDLKVWVEFIMDYPLSGANNSSANVGGILSHFCVALRSPNTNFKYAYPLWNDPRLATFVDNSTARDNQSNPQVAGMPDLFKNTYLLWAGSQTYGAIDTAISRASNDIIVWNKDFNMRTIFADGAGVANPNHLDRVFGTSTNVLTLSGSSPSRTAELLFGPYPWSPTNATGSFVPWMIDQNTIVYQLTGTGFPAYTVGSPPPGWLTGPGSVASVNEWPTNGQSLGPNAMRPVCPLLDDVYATLAAKDPSSANSPISVMTASFVPLGFRPGLRGTEAHGNWSLLIGSNPNGDIGNTNPRLLSGSRNDGFWFRQFRMELTLDQGVGPRDPTSPSRLRFYKKRSLVPARTSRQWKQAVLSGNFTWEAGGVFVSQKVPEEYGRSVGITDQTGSFEDFAVFTRLTGSLADMLAVSASLATGTAGALYAYLHNEFGTPYIPISSGSSVAPAFSFFDMNDVAMTKSIISSILRPRPNLPQAHRLKDTVSRLGPAKKRSDALAEKIIEAQKNSLL
jgi:hypothetical protein